MKSVNRASLLVAATVIVAVPALSRHARAGDVEATNAAPSAAADKLQRRPRRCQSRRTPSASETGHTGRARSCAGCCKGRSRQRSASRRRCSARCHAARRNGGGQARSRRCHRRAIARSRQRQVRQHARQCAGTRHRRCLLFRPQLRAAVADRRQAECARGSRDRLSRPCRRRRAHSRRLSGSGFCQCEPILQHSHKPRSGSPLPSSLTRITPASAACTGRG